MVVTMVLGQLPGDWCAHAPGLADRINATGKTRESVIENFRDAMLDLFDYKREQGEEVPDVTALDIHELREVATLELMEAVAA